MSKPYTPSGFSLYFKSRTKWLWIWWKLDINLCVGYRKVKSRNNPTGRAPDGLLCFTWKGNGSTGSSGSRKKRGQTGSKAAYCYREVKLRSTTEEQTAVDMLTFYYTRPLSEKNCFAFRLDRSRWDIFGRELRSRSWGYPLRSQNKPKQNPLQLPRQYSDSTSSQRETHIQYIISTDWRQWKSLLCF